MREVEKYVSQFTENLFPDFYQEEGSTYIAFVKAYFEWLEEADQVMYRSRRLPEYRDIDKTLDEFILYFKEKYLKNIQFTTASNKELFIKNALDFYRAKGTERAVDLFFKLIHGIEARVYYPGDDLFRLSDNEWVDVQYLEVTHTDENVGLVGKKIYGTVSGTEAFIERLVRKKSQGIYIDVFYITNVVGDFITGEVIRCDLACSNYPTIIGSMSSIDVVFGGSNFDVGEVVTITGSTTGTGGKARITEIATTTGIVTFSISEGGFGFNTNSSILISENVITANQVSVTNTEFTLQPTSFDQFETVTENLANAAFANASADFTVGDVISTYDGGGNVLFHGTVLTVTQTSGANVGSIIINYDTGSPALANTDTIYNAGNVVSANVTVSTDVSATGNVIASAQSGVIKYTKNTATTNISVGAELYQTSGGVEFANATVSNVSSNAVSGSTFVGFDGMKGCFRTDQLIYRRSDGGSYNIIELKGHTFGVINVQNAFIRGGNVYATGSGSHGTITEIDGGTGASFSILAIDNEYPYTYNEDIIADYANVFIDATAYGFPGNTSANLTFSTIGDAFTFSNGVIGTITEIGLFSEGTGYGVDPYVVVYEPTITPRSLYDYIITYGSETGNFLIGETITGATSNAQAIITSIDTGTNTIEATRITLDESLTTSETITGSSTGSSATLTAVNIRSYDPITGLNADILGQAASAVGGVIDVDLISSGFGYTSGETVTLTSTIDSTKTAQGISYLTKQGVGEGYYKNRRSFLSSDKYLHDSDYYQEYSYEVLTSLPFDDYKDTLIKVLHVAGTKPFGSYVGTEEADSIIKINNETLTIE